jgi:hypothetical protein
MKTRAYEFVTGIEASTQPDAGTPTDPNDLVTLGYIGGLGVGNQIQEVPTGLVNNSNLTYTLSQTPLSAAGFKLFINGRKAILGAEFTRAGVTITIVGGALNFGTTIEADYSY